MRGWAELSTLQRRFLNRALIRNHSAFAPQRRFLEEQYGTKLAFAYEHPEVPTIIQRTGRPYNFEVVHFPSDQDEPTVVLGHSLTGIVAAEAVDHFTPDAIRGLLGILTAITWLEADTEWQHGHPMTVHSSAELTAAAEYLVRRNFDLPLEIDAYNSEWLKLQADFCASSGVAANLAAYQTVAYLSAIVGATNPVEGARIRQSIRPGSAANFL